VARKVQLAIANAKGGVGKSTVAVNLAAELAAIGYMTLLIDCEPQADASAHLGIAPAAPNLVEVLTGSAGITRAIVKARDGLDLITGDERLTDLDTSEFPLDRLQAAAASLLPSYDAVIADCPPTLTGLAGNAIVAVGEVLCPVIPDYLSFRRIEQVEQRCEVLGARLRWIVAGNANVQRALTADVLAELRRRYPKQLARTYIRTDARLAEAPAWGKTVREHAPSSHGAADYAALTQELIHAKT